MQTLDAFRAVAEITADVSIRRNDNLKEIDLSNLSSTTVLIIEENLNLTTIDLGTPLNISADLKINGNLAFADCCVLQPLLDDDFNNGFVGISTIILDNGDLCNSTEEILQNCSEGPVGCENISILSENNKLIINGIVAKNAVVKVFDNNWQFTFECNADCEATIVLDKLTAGEIYHTDIQFYDENWQFICADKQDVEIVGGAVICEPICTGEILLPNQAAIDNFCGCEEIEGTIIIGEEGINNSIVDLKKLAQLKSITGDLILRNTQLKNLDVFNQLEKVGGTLVINSHTQLENITGLSNVLEIGNGFVCQRNPLLKTFSGIEQVGKLREIVIGGESIESVQAFANIDIANINALSIVNCGNLVDLSGLEGIRSTQITLFTIAYNSQLTNLDALQNVNRVRGSSAIAFNDNLSNCCAIAHLIDDDPNNGTVDIPFDIRGNPSFCNSKEEILANCSDNPANLCEGVSITTDENTRTLKIDNLAAPIEIVKVFNSNWQMIYDCFADCPDMFERQELSDSRYYIQIDMYDADWTPICDIDETITFDNGSQSRSNDLLPTDFALVPNPAQDQVQIQFAQPIEEAGHIRIYNYLGKELAFQTFEKIENRRLAIDLSDWTNGVYFVEIKTKSKRVTNKKLMVNRLY